ncbi:uncharacterized protein LOC130507149 [Raphanus sativus]|uniref:Uncharacterized protein LOC130504589 n=1 Tax=Raphanus sativus TaxID=3726 RepID=A0A9W3CU82_RAPSA|nr:uncharacterized protein LOC130504589 [Raphanus sativus]XP_056857839.1 uncharacterized protein LOC130507149 [Raphanus sativus]
MMMMTMENEFQDRNNLNINDIDLSLLRLSSPPYDHSRSSFSAAASPPDISPLKRSSPVSDESDQHKRRRLSLQLQDPIFITSPLRSTYQETHSSSVNDPTHVRSVPEKQETSPLYDSESLEETEKLRMKRVNNHVEEITHEEETNYETQQHEEEEDCGEGMRIERCGDGFVIRLKCRCKLAYRVLFSDHHLYFKSL